MVTQRRESAVTEVSATTLEAIGCLGFKQSANLDCQQARGRLIIVHFHRQPSVRNQRSPGDCLLTIAGTGIMRPIAAAIGAFGTVPS